jgi:serine/threonine protein kinase
VGVCHRDIKPSNLLITKEHKIVIVDFNVAKARPRDQVVYDAHSHFDNEPSVFDKRMPFEQAKETPFVMLSNQRGTLSYAAPERIPEQCSYT